MNNIKSITSTIQKKNKSLKSKIDKNFPKVASTLVLNMTVFYSYLGHSY